MDGQILSPIKIGGIERFSIVDFPNVMAAVVFMQGCCWRCPFCHNAHLQDIQAETNISWQKFTAFLEQRKGVLEAVVFSGGEPLVQAGLKEAILQVKALDYKIGLHTGGYLPERFNEVLPLVDWVGFDVKAPLEAARYREITGGFGDVEKVKESLQALCKSGKHFECRTTCDPRFLTVEDLYTIAKTLKELGVKEYYLQKYRRIPTDTQTTDGQCAALVSNADLLAQLKTDFEIFEVRS